MHSSLKAVAVGGLSLGLLAGPLTASAFAADGDLPAPRIEAAYGLDTGAAAAVSDGELYWNDLHPIVAGTTDQAPDGSLVQLRDARTGDVLCEAEVDADGYLCWPEQNYPLGTTPVTAYVVSDGFDSKPSETVQFHLDGDPTVAPPVDPTQPPVDDVELVGATVTTTSLRAGVSNTFVGTATPGAAIRIVNKWGTPLVADAITADADGAWSFDRVISKNAASFAFAVEQTKGDRTSTSAVFTIHAEADAFRPATVTTESFAAGSLNRFAGTATPGASLRILNKWGTELIPGAIIAGTDGSWSFDRVVSASAAQFAFKVEQTLDGQVDTSGLFTVEAGAGLSPATVTTTGLTAGVSNTFEGTATPNATVRIVNKWGTPLVPGTIEVGADGRWSFDRVVSASATNFAFAVEQTLGDVSSTSALFVVAAR